MLWLPPSLLNPDPRPHLIIATRFYFDRCLNAIWNSQYLIIITNDDDDDDNNNNNINNDNDDDVDDDDNNNNNNNYNYNYNYNHNLYFTRVT